MLPCAQNNTHVHHEFLTALLAYCDSTGAQLMVAPFTYNKAGWESVAGKISKNTDGR